MLSPLPPELLWLYVQIKPYLRWQALSFLCFTSASLLALAQPLLIKWFIDKALPQRQAAPFLACAALMFFAYGGRTLCTSLGTYLTLFSAQRAALDLRMRLLKHLNTLGADYHDTAPLGSRFYPFCEPVDEIAYFGSDLFPSILRTLFATLLTFCAMLALDAKMTIAIAAVIPVFLVARHYFRARLERAAETVQTQRRLLNGFLQEHLAAIVQIQLLRREQRQERIAFRFLSSTFRCQQRLSKTGVLFSTSTNLAIAIAAASVLATGGRSVCRGTLTIGSFIAFYSYVTQLFEPLSGAIDMYGMALRTFSSIRQVQRIFSLAPSIKDHVKAIPVPETVPVKLEFQRVCFGYVGRKSIIHIASLEIPSCQRVAVVGRNGAGKSTFARLAARLYDPTSGTVRVGDLDMREIQLESLRAKVCYLPQIPTLFDDSFLHNLRLGRPDASESELLDLIKIVGLDEVIENMPERWNERIGPFGAKLSGGERQRLALARTLLQRPRILILDEATSALDPGTEHAILRKIPLVLPNTTLIFLSHRLHSLTWVDRILVFEAGHIVQDGAHEVLRKQIGLYGHLFRASTSSREVCSK